jgi:hypothetical protein
VVVEKLFLLKGVYQIRLSLMPVAVVVCWRAIQEYGALLDLLYGRDKALHLAFQEYFAVSAITTTVTCHSALLC